VADLNYIRFSYLILEILKFRKQDNRNVLSNCIDLLKEKFGMQFVENTDLFPNPRQTQMPDLLKRYVPLATQMNTEKARNERRYNGNG